MGTHSEGQQPCLEKSHLAEAASESGLKECSAWAWQDEALLWTREGKGVLCAQKARDPGRKELEDELARVFGAVCGTS